MIRKYFVQTKINSVWRLHSLLQASQTWGVQNWENNLPDQHSTQWYEQAYGSLLVFHCLFWVTLTTGHFDQCSKWGTGFIININHCIHDTSDTRHSCPGDQVNVSFLHSPPHTLNHPRPAFLSSTASSWYNVWHHETVMTTWDSLLSKTSPLTLAPGRQWTVAAAGVLKGSHKDSISGIIRTSLIKTRRVIQESFIKHRQNQLWYKTLLWRSVIISEETLMWGVTTTVLRKLPGLLSDLTKLLNIHDEPLTISARPE